MFLRKPLRLTPTVTNNYLKLVTVVTVLLSSSLFILPLSSSVNAVSGPSLYPSKLNKVLGFKWWQWLLSIPESENPIVNDNPCDVKQSGPFFYLVGTFGGSAERQCDIPKGKSIFFPIINVVATLDKNDPAFDTIDKVKKAATDFIDAAENLQASVDGVEIKNIGDLRAQSPVFQLKIPQDVFGIPSGKYTAVADGYWVALKPLNVGEHTIHFAGSIPGQLEVDVTYHITIK
jgi:hypothetical protein